jgi:CRISPR-associated protein Cst1
MLSYTGHPLIDVGVATLAAFAGKKDPATLVPEDLEKAVQYMQENYVVNPLKSFLTVAFPNSGYTNPAFEKNPEKRSAYAERILRAWCRGDTGEEGSGSPENGQSEGGYSGLPAECVYTRRPAVLYAYRQHIPLITGEEVINFHPYGFAGLPVSGEALLAVQAFPLGCAKVQGRLLAVHADDPDLTYRFVRMFLEENRKAILTAQQTGSSKLPEAPHRAGTLLLDRLLRIEQERQEENGVSEPGEFSGRPSSVTAYHLSNSGQGVGLDIYHLPLEIFDFLRVAQTPRYSGAWKKICQRGWEIVKVKKTRKGEESASGSPRYNVLYEDILRLPERTASFIRCYFLRLPARVRREGDPRATYSFKNEAELVSWALVELFLRKVVFMDAKRVQQIRELGDTLAEYVHRENDRRFFQAFYTARNYNNLREALIRVSVARIKKGQPPLIDFDPYIEIFEHGENLPDVNWRLIRDLVLIRVIERLYELGWIQEYAKEMPEPEEEIIA